MSGNLYKRKKSSIKLRKSILSFFSIVPAKFSFETVLCEILYNVQYYSLQIISSLQGEVEIMALEYQM